jgi:hypothetical protein
VQVQDRREHLGRLDAEGAVVAEAGDDARLVVVVPVQAVPADVGEPGLPAPERGLEVRRSSGRTSHLSSPWSSCTCSNWNTMSTSPRAGSVNSRASSTVTPGISPTVRSAPSGPAKTSRCISCRNSWMRGPEAKCSNPSAYSPPAGAWASGREVVLEMKLMTSMRNPSTPRSSHHRIIA